MPTHEIKITGMTCGGCSGRVARVLEANDGVLNAVISHDTDSGVIQTDDSLSLEQVLEIVNGTGFNASA